MVFAGRRSTPASFNRSWANPNEGCVARTGAMLVLAAEAEAPPWWRCIRVEVSALALALSPSPFPHRGLNEALTLAEHGPVIDLQLQCSCCWRKIPCHVIKGIQ